IIDGFNDSIIEKYETFLLANNIQVAGIEFIRDHDGNIFTYDINTNTNYNADAEAVAGKYGMLELAHYLKSELEKI
ncbi:MAG: alpha-L-glutamate ligase, partial [Bacillota bacterium]|nr:alpha-L-glutamate ligase [Bacillota bacterium]